jgi:hypothetical protein
MIKKMQYVLEIMGVNIHPQRLINMLRELDLIRIPFEWTENVPPQPDHRNHFLRSGRPLTNLTETP